jgi:hypothetical protein
MMNRITIAASTLLLAQHLPAQWTSIHRDASANRHVPIAGITTVNGTPAEQSSGSAVTGSGALLISGTTLYAVKRATASCSIVALDKDTLLPLAGYTPASLDSDFDYSLSAPTIDSGSLYFGAGETTYRLNAATGAVEWSTTLTSANTDVAVGAQYAIVNSGPAITASCVFYQTFDSSFAAPANKSQLVALDRATGNVAWWVRTGGTGTNTPLISGSTVIVHAMRGTENGALVAYDATAASPTVLWDSSTLAVDPWITTNLFWADSVLLGGNIYAVTYSFSGANGQLICANATTGARIFAAASITADCPPVVVGANVYLLGGPFAAPTLASYNATTGALGYSQGLTLNGFIFRNYMTATNDFLYFAGSSDGLMVHDLATGALVTRSASTNADGPVTIDNDGRIFVRNTAELNVFDSTSTVADWDSF